MSKTHISKTNIRFLLTALLLVISINANAITSGQATDEAFAALLSMPGAEPQEGSWIFETPPEFEPRTEDNLILWLKKKKKQGADFNAQRHFGTLLDHALRSKLERTALWLLDNGGTSIRAASLMPGATSSQNALLGFAKQYGNNKVAETLLQRGAMPYLNRDSNLLIPLTDLQIEQRDATSVQPIFLDLLLTCKDEVCVTRLFKLNIRRPFDDAKFTLSTITKLNEDRPYALTQQILDAQLSALDRIPTPALQKVLDDPKLVRQIIQIFYASTHRPEISEEYFNEHQNNLSQKVALSLLNKISDAVLNQALDDDETLRQWLAWVSPNPIELFDRPWFSEEFKPYLQRVNDATLHAHIPAAIKGMATRARVNFTRGNNGSGNHVSQANWLQLFARLSQTIDFTQLPLLLNKTTPELWPKLFAMGYQLRDLDADLGAWLSGSSAQQLKQHWDMLLLANPALKEEAMRLALKRDMVGGGGIEREDLEKVQFMLKQGAVAPRLTLHPTIMRESDKAIIQQLLALQVIVPLPIPATSRLVPARLNCQFTLNEVWYRALTNNSVIHGEEVFETVFIDQLHFVEIPEQNNCGMLVSGTQQVNEYQSGEQDNFDGPTDEPRIGCADPTDRSELWREVGGKIEALPLYTKDGDWRVYIKNGGLQGLRNSNDGHLYYLNWGSGDRCSSSWTTLMDWQQVDSQWVLKPLDEKHPAQQAFLLQCDPEKIEECLGIKSNEYLYGKERENFLHENPYSSQTPIELINNYKTQEHEAYLAAILELNKPKLEALQAHGIPPQWTEEALQAVNKSALPLADKRQRTAWIFRDHEQLASALRTDIVENFIDWLPREDWRPVLKALKGNAYLLSNLAEKARTKGLDDLACDFDHARSLMCGETWRVEKVEAQ